LVDGGFGSVWIGKGLNRRGWVAGDGSDGFDKGLNRRGWVAGDDSDGFDGFDKGLNWRGWVVVFDHGLLCRAWSRRSGLCLVGEALVMLGWRGLGSVFGQHGSWSGGFFFFFLIWVFVSMGFWWAVGSCGVVGMVEARWW